MHLINGKICDWDGRMSQALVNAVDKLQHAIQDKIGSNGLQSEYQYQAYWPQYWNVIIGSVIDSLKECDQVLQSKWNQIHYHSNSLRGKEVALQASQKQVGQQAIGLAVGVPGGAAVGAGIYPLFKFCMKFFIK